MRLQVLQSGVYSESSFNKEWPPSFHPFDPDMGQDV